MLQNAWPVLPLMRATTPHHTCRQVAALQAELAMHDAMAGRQAGQVTYGPYTPQQREMLREQVAAFLAPGAPEDSIEPIELMSLRHIREVG